MIETFFGLLTGSVFGFISAIYADSWGATPKVQETMVWLGAIIGIVVTL